MRSASDTAPNPKPVAEPEDDRDETFLRRWSRRKQEGRAQPAELPANEPPTPAAPPEKVLTDADMPPIESLNADSDYGMFMSPGVSEGLRRLALRKLFTLPEINQRCPLDSEWYDCRNLEPLGDIVTHEMREALEREAEKLKDAAIAALGEGPASDRSKAFGASGADADQSVAGDGPHPNPPPLAGEGETGGANPGESETA